MAIDPQHRIARIRASPRQVIDKARAGSMVDLTDLANWWTQVPQLVPLGVINVFFHHLDGATLDSIMASQSPTPTPRQAEQILLATNALFALCHCGPLVSFGGPYHDGTALRRAWPGIFKWSAYLLNARVFIAATSASSEQERRTTMDTVCSCWYAFVAAEGMQQVMAQTQGAVELLTKLWLIDQDVRGQKTVDIPCVAAAFDALLIDVDCADRVMRAVGGKSSAKVVAKLVVTRTKAALARPQLDPVELQIYLDIFSHLARGEQHPLRHALLAAGAISLCTHAALTLGRALDAGGPPDLLDGIVAGFGFLANCLHSTEGFTWVTQALHADLLLALATCSPYLARLDREDFGMLSMIFKQLLPQYLVYRSVINAVDAGIRRLDEKQQQRIQAGRMKQVWLDFLTLARERMYVVMHAQVVKGKAATCDNVQCQKIDAKNTFQKCAGCQSTLYCSRECQTVAWKEGGHKEMCKLKQQERLEGKAQAISKGDSAFFHHLSTRDARHHMPLLRRLAQDKHPGVPANRLVVRIDYTRNPPTYSVLTLDEAEIVETSPIASANAEARSDALFDRARENPDRLSLVQSVVANGSSAQMVLSVVTGNFWDDEGVLPIEEEDGGDRSPAARDTSVDAVDMMMARTTLDGFVTSQGELAAR